MTLVLNGQQCSFAHKVCAAARAIHWYIFSQALMRTYARNVCTEEKHNLQVSLFPATSAGMTSGQWELTGWVLLAGATKNNTIGEQVAN
jgi:hypothetical protein